AAFREMPTALPSSPALPPPRAPHASWSARRPACWSADGLPIRWYRETTTRAIPPATAAIASGAAPHAPAGSTSLTATARRGHAEGARGAADGRTSRAGSPVAGAVADDDGSCAGPG